ncbi:hypothetical protein D3C81_1187020 [compost metagenome]
MEDAARMFMNPDMEVTEFDSDSGKPMMLCVIPAGGEPVRLAVPAVYVELLRQFDGVRTRDEAIEAFRGIHGETFDTSWLQRLIETSLRPRGMLVEQGQDPMLAGAPTKPRRSFLFVKLPVIPPAIVDPIARVLGFLFHRPMLIAGLLAFVASHVYVYGVLVHGQHVNFNSLDGGSILLLMLLSTLGTICHEFGHASAAAHFGCRRMTIGWGIYMVYTVLWTNVSEAWKLPRRQRAIVDIGGVHFESMFLLLMLGLHLATGNPIFLFAFIFIDLSIANTFNPFLRMDGYWLISDLFGVVNLRQQQNLLLQVAAHRLVGAPPPASRPTLSPRATVALVVYTILGTVFLAYIMYAIFTFAVMSVAVEYPGMLRAFWVQLQSGADFLALLGSAFELLWRALILTAATVTIWNLSRSGIRTASRIVSLRTPRAATDV